jgi:hypothetical protein
VDNNRIINWTALFSVLALAAHAIDAPDHLTEWWGYGAFFVTIASFQFFYGLALFLRPWRYDDSGAMRASADRYGRPYFVLGTLLTSSVIIIYIVTRTTGVPFFGPDAIVEPVTFLSLLPPVECVPLMFCHLVLLSRTGAAAPNQA